MEYTNGEKPMVSFIMPYIDDREEQLLLTIKSLERQSVKDWEIILVCHSDTNPATAINFGVSQAKGDVICLTSPEILNATDNVAIMNTIPRGTYWVGWCIEAYPEDLPWCWKADCLRDTPPICEGIYAHCTGSDWAPWKYFLGVLRKDEWVPMDEFYTDGIAYEDRDWADRVMRKLRCEFNSNIVGIHLYHSRDYQHNGPALRKRNREYYMKRYNAGIGEEMALNE